MGVLKNLFLAIQSEAWVKVPGLFAWSLKS